MNNNDDERDFAEEKANREIGEMFPPARIQAEDGIRQESRRFQQIQNQVGRYFKARYGDSVAFRAPETFENALERWMIYATASGNGSEQLAEETMALIEEKIKA
jgi:hypothetical protein